MQTLQKNIIGAFGSEGEIWLANLENVVDSLQKEWKLRNVEPVENMTYHFVAKAYDEKSHPVVLKIGCHPELIETEAYLLDHFSGQGAVRLLKFHSKYQALLLEQAVPGISLKSLYPDQIENVVDAYLDTVNQLHNIPHPDNRNFLHIQDWLQALDKTDASVYPDGMVKKAVKLRDQMLATRGSVTLLHGDLHLDNILKNGDEWLTIDPKGVLGEPEFEVAAFDFISDQETASKELFFERIDFVAKRANLSFERLRDWVFIRLVLSIAWSFEDNVDPSQAMTLAKVWM